MANIIIQLMSDLCIGNGESIGNGIDNDICRDNFGFPFIPGRRLLGCLRDAAMDLIRYGFADASEEIIDLIFGNPNGQEGKLFLENAMIPGIESLHGFVQSLKETPEKRVYLIRQTTEEKIIRLYTSVRGQTQIGDDGKALNGSLRFIRVLNQYDPVSKEPMKFICSADISALNDFEIKFLENTCKALRHIGLNRNRGLGNVRVTLADSEKIDNREAVPKARMVWNPHKEPEHLLCIPYQVELDSPISIQEFLEAGSSIRSRTVIGALANYYIKKHGGDDIMFTHLFLDGTVKWSALTPVINGIISDPAPAILMKLKNDGGKLINSFVCDEEWKTKKPKSLDGYFASIDEEEGIYHVAQVSSEISYHNRLTELNGTNREQKGLYMQDALSSGMVYGGYILLPDDRNIRKNIEELLEVKKIRLGRSKKVQYGTATIRKAELIIQQAMPCGLEENEPVFAILKSDLVLQDNAMFNIGNDTVRDKIAKAFGIRNERPEGYYDICRYHVISGFNTMWQMQKPKVRAVQAGSVYCFQACPGKHPRRQIIGEYQQEGLGRIDLISQKQMLNISIVEPGVIMMKNHRYNTELAKQLEQMLLYETILERIRDNVFVFIKKHGNDLHSIPVGRVRRMLHDAKNYQDLWEMTKSMKTSDISSEFKGKKKTVQDLLELLYGARKINWTNIISDSELEKELNANPEIINKVEEHWKEPLLTVLKNRHYKKGGRRR